MAAAIQWSQVGEVIWVSLIAGIGAVILFSVVVYASSRSAEARRTGGNGGYWVSFATLGTLLFFGLVVFAVIVIINK